MSIWMSVTNEHIMNGYISMYVLCAGLSSFDLITK